MKKTAPPPTPPPAEPAKKPREKSGNKPAILEPARRERLLEALRTGATHPIACGHAGISVSRFYEYLARGRKGDPNWVDLYNDVKSAESKPAMRALAGVQKAASTTIGGVDKDGKPIQVPNEGFDWRAGSWYLERRHPREYGRLIFETSQPKVIEGMTEAEQLGLVLDWVTEALTKAGHGELADEVRAVLEAPDPSAIGGG